MALSQDPSTVTLRPDAVAHTCDYEGQLGDGGRIPTVIERDGEQERCPYCGDWYSRIGSHWSQGSCPYPPISGYKMELLRGMMLGDGSLKQNTEYPSFGVSNTNKRFLQWFSRELGWIAPSPVSKHMAVCEYDFSSLDGDVDRESCHDGYRITTRSHPQFQVFCSWIGVDEVFFPIDIEPSIPMMRMWYVSDGGVQKRNGYVQFGSRNESERPEAINNIFSSFGYDIRQSGQMFRLTVDQSRQFLDEIGPPVPGFRHKWAIDDVDRYNRLKDKADREYKTQTL